MRRCWWFAVAACWSVPAGAQVYHCDVVQHWRNSVVDGRYVNDGPGVVKGARFLLDFNRGKVTSGNLLPEDGKVIAVAGASSIGMLTGGARELAIFAVFPRIPDPNGGVLGSVMRLEDNDYMPKGTMMTRLSCRMK